MHYSWLSVRIFIGFIQSYYYDLKYWLTDKLGLWSWVYTRAEKTYQKEKAYYKKMGINPDSDD